LGDIPVAVLNSTGNYYIYPDHLNTPRAIADSTNKTVWRWKDPAFGTSQPDQDPDKDGKAFVYNLRFPGQYYDQSTGLHYNWFRDYDPVTGRYLESDPIGLRGGLNTYTYVTGNPVNAIDRYGLDTTLITTYDYGIGSHSALSISIPGQPDFLYDPGGSYLSSTRGSGGFFSEDNADLGSYSNYQKGTGSALEFTKLPLTSGQEADLIKQIENGIDPGPGFCASAISSALQGCGIKQTTWPGSLKNQAEKVKSSK
jgi:RHS repeat-associated protein